MPPDPGIDDVPPWLLAALAAWPRGDMTPGQQKAVLKWIVEDLTGALAIVPVSAEPGAMAYTVGQQRIGKVLLKMTGATLGLRDHDDGHDHQA